MNITDRITLKNGLRIIVSRLNNTHSAAVNLLIRAGVIHENDKETGITHLLEHLYFREMLDLTQEQLYYYMESLGTRLEGSTYRDSLSFHLKVPSENFIKALEVFKYILQTDKWTIEAFEAEKGVVLREIAEDSKYNIDEYARYAAYGRTKRANQILGDCDSISSITLADTIKYRNRIFNKENMILSIAGDIGEADIRQMCSLLENIPLKDGDVLHDTEIPVDFGKRDSNVLFENNKWNIYDVDFCFDIDYTKISADEAEFLGCILGRGDCSRLNMCLREQKAYTYETGSYIEKFENMAIIHIYYSVSEENFYNALSDLVSVLNSIKSDINEYDFHRSLPFFNEYYDFYLDDPDELSYLNAANMLLLEKEFEKYKIDDIDTACKKFQNLSKQLFTTKNLSFAVMGRCKKLKKKKVLNILSRLDA